MGDPPEIGLRASVTRILPAQADVPAPRPARGAAVNEQSRLTAPRDVQCGESLSESGAALCDEPGVAVAFAGHRVHVAKCGKHSSHLRCSRVALTLEKPG